MYGYELTKARKELRLERRRAAVEQLPGAVALDLEDLALRLDEGVQAHYSAVIRRRLLLRGLTTLGLESAALAAALGMTGPDLERETKAALLADPAIGAAIDLDVVQQLPETAEPDRFKPARV